jgi:hypothetical protein
VFWNNFESKIKPQRHENFSCDAVVADGRLQREKRNFRQSEDENGN